MVVWPQTLRVTLPETSEIVMAPPEYRQNPLLETRVIVAPERATRPGAERVRQLLAPREAGGLCPFCPGREMETPDAVLTVPGEARSGSDWRVRVIPNKYPALRASTCAGEVESRSSRDRSTGESTPSAPINPLQTAVVAGETVAAGFHEVVVETPEHNAQLRSFSQSQLIAVLTAFRDRMLDLEARGTIEHVLVFRNCGLLSGATIEHPHSQIMAATKIPPLVSRQCERFDHFQAERGDCLLCREVEHERRGGARVIATIGDCIAYCPYASRFPYEQWIMPVAHESRFSLTDDQQLESIAQLLSGCCRRLETVLAGADFNVILYSAPVAADMRSASVDEFSAFHWHFEILPRTAQLAGFELGAGVYLNPCPPEVAAARLRRGG